MAYRESITGKYQTLYSDGFPIHTIIQPPRGWRMLKVNRHRQNCPDAGWRLVLKRI